MVFQDGALFPHLSVLANVRYGMARAERRGRPRSSCSSSSGLADKAERLPGTLSGGEQQRVALARALARRPGVLLLDEPFSSLDTALRAQLRGEVRGLLKEVGVTTVLVTHDQHEALMFGDRVAVMRAGRLEQVDTPSALYRATGVEWVAGFVGEANLLAGHVVDRGIATAVGTVPRGRGVGDPGGRHVRPRMTPHRSIAGARRRVVVLCRPEDLELRPGGDAVVGDVAYLGQESRFEVDLPTGERVDRAGLRRRPRHRPGDRVAVHYGGRVALRSGPAPDRGGTACATPRCLLVGGVRRHGRRGDDATMPCPMRSGSNSR